MLSWFVEENGVDMAIAGTELTKADIVVERAPMRCVDENVNLERICRFFNRHAWMYETRYESVGRNVVWTVWLVTAA